MEGQFDLRTEQADRVNHAAAPAKLRHVAENVFDADSDVRFLFVGGLLSLRQRVVARLSLANLRDETRFSEVFDVGRSRVAGVRKNVSVCGVRIQKVLKMLRIMHVHGRYDDFTYEFSARIDTRVQLVAEVIFAAVLRPPSNDFVVKSVQNVKFCELFSN